MTWDIKTDNNIETLHPKIQELAKKGIDELESKYAMYCRVTFGLRSIDLQNSLYNQPWDKKDNDGDGLIDEKDEKVTNAKGGDSIHNYGLAFDVVEIRPIYGYSRAYDDRRWMVIRDTFVKLGFKWGGYFKRFPDKPHFEMTFGKTLAEIKQMYKEQGCPEFINFD